MLDRLVAEVEAAADAAHEASVRLWEYRKGRLRVEPLPDDLLADEANDARLVSDVRGTELEYDKALQRYRTANR
jgi:hypothetical protein